MNSLDRSILYDLRQFSYICQVWEIFHISYILFFFHLPTAECLLSVTVLLAVDAFLENFLFCHSQIHCCYFSHFPVAVEFAMK